LRDDPPGVALDHWLNHQTPAPLDEVVELVATLAELVQGIHAQGAVLRDLDPRNIVIDVDGRPWLTDVGLGRVDVLSTRTAASLILDASPYAAPEILAGKLVDQRADLYGLGAILYHALTGTLPYGDTLSLLRPSGPPPRVSKTRPEVSAELDELVARCLAEDPAARVGSANEFAEALRGHAPLRRKESSLPCQGCGALLCTEQRLCTHCGQLSVQIVVASDLDREGHDIELFAIDENAETRAALERILGAVTPGPLPPLNFLVGSKHKYTQVERWSYDELPVKLVEGLSIESAKMLNRRFRRAGLETRIVGRRAKRRSLTRPQSICVVVVLGLLLGAWFSVGFGVFVFVMFMLMFGLASMNAGHETVDILRDGPIQTVRNWLSNKRTSLPPLVEIRSAPVALPASDPLVARLAALLRDEPPDDLRAVVGELAVAVQRMVDHRATNLGEAAEIDAVTAPIEQLVTLIEAQVEAVHHIDAELEGLDEGHLVRALAAAEAREDAPSAREHLLDGLDRLRVLEDARAQRFHRLLEASRLAHRSVELGLAVQDPEAEHERQVALALVALDEELSTRTDAALR